MLIACINLNLTFISFQNIILGGSYFTTVGVFFHLQLSFFAHSPLRCFLDTVSHCKQRSSTVSEKARVVSKKAPKHNSMQKSSVVSRKLPTVSKKRHTNSVPQKAAIYPRFFLRSFLAIFLRKLQPNLQFCTLRFGSAATTIMFQRKFCI